MRDTIQVVVRANYSPMWSFYFSVTIRLAKRKNKGKKIDEISNLGDFSDNCRGQVGAALLPSYIWVMNHEEINVISKLGDFYNSCSGQVGEAPPPQLHLGHQKKR